MHVLVATTGVLTPGPVVEFVKRLLGGSGKCTVTTVIEVPRSFLEELRGDTWHPLEDGASASWTDEEDALIARYVDERGRRLTEPLVAALDASGVESTAVYREGEDPAVTISRLAKDIDAGVIVLGATRQIFDQSAWESVSARVMLESGRPVLVVPPQQKEAIDDKTEAVVD
ncbi:MAG: universal stress protein [bacterium]|nr:universal stress protein [bacterium]